MSDAKQNELAAPSGSVSDILARLNAHIANMAPHQKDRVQGQLLMDATGHIVHLERKLEKWKGMYSEAHAINEGVRTELAEAQKQLHLGCVNSGCHAERQRLRTELAKANRSIERCVKQAFDAESRLETCRAQLAALSLNCDSTTKKG